MSTLVIGGGVTGLLAAWHLHRRGEAVELWEAAPGAGGWVRTEPWPDTEGRPGHLEIGPQGVLVAPDTPADRLFKALELPLRCPGHGARWLGRGGRLRPVPLAPAALLFSDLLPLPGRLRLMLEPFQKVRSAEPEESLHAFAARRLGKGAAEYLLPAMIAGVLAAPPSILSVDAVPRLRQWEACGSLTRGMARGGRSAMSIPVGGMGELPRRLAAGLPKLRTACRAEALEALPDGRWRVRAEGYAAEADRVILALPAFDAARLLGAHAPASAEALAAIPYTTVRLFHSRHAPLAPYAGGFGFLVHPPEGRGYLGSLVPSWMDPDSAPEGTMQLRSFTGGAFPTDEAFTRWEGVREALRAWLPGLGEASQVREILVERAIPRAEMGHRARVAQALGGLPKGVDWLSNARLGPGVRDVIEGLEAWAGSGAR